LRSDHLAGASSPVILLAFVLGAAAALSAGARFQDSQDVLRVKGLIVEDAEGRPRIVLGAPLAELEGRVRSDPAVGLVVLDENGRDRVSVGSPAIAPQSGGEVVPRVGGTSGIVFSDETGNERGGFGYLEGGRVVLGIDYPDGREAVALFHNPDWGFSGMTVNGRSETEPQRVFLGTQYTGVDAGLLNLDAPDGRWASLMVGGEGPRWLVRPAPGDSMVDVLGPTIGR